MSSSPYVGTQLVTDRFILDWRTWFGSSENQVIVTSVDGRGSTGRGDSFLHAVHRQLGTVDVADQLETLRCSLCHLSRGVDPGGWGTLPPENM